MSSKKKLLCLIRTISIFKFQSLNPLLHETIRSAWTEWTHISNMRCTCDKSAAFTQAQNCHILAILHMTTAEFFWGQDFPIFCSLSRPLQLFNVGAFYHHKQFSDQLIKAPACYNNWPWRLNTTDKFCVHQKWPFLRHFWRTCQPGSPSQFGLATDQMVFRATLSFRQNLYVKPSRRRCLLFWVSNFVQLRYRQHHRILSQVCCHQITAWNMSRYIS